MTKKITVQEITKIGLFVSLITCGTFLDDILPKMGGYDIFNFWFIIASLTMVLLKPLSAIITINTTFLLWLAIGKGGLSYGFWSVLFDYYVPLNSVLFILLAKQRWQTIPLIVAAAFVRWFSHSTVGVFFWGADWKYSLTFNAPWTFISMGISLPIVYTLYGKLLEIHLYTNQSGHKY